ncbi:MAG: ATP-binding domain-containing protein [Actinomycetota bacterium]
MTKQHPEFEDEQRFIDHAYECLEITKTDAWKIREMNEASMGGTYQARFERNAFDEVLVGRLTQLDLGDSALVFGRIDRLTESPDAFESFHIGRIAVADPSREPVVVDWRAPVAEPFYRATGREPMGLARRRHFEVQGRELLGIEDELFGVGHLGVGHDEGLDGEPASSTPTLRGYSTLLSVLSRGRTGQLGDIVATIQAEQDQIIRSPQQGVLVVEGGPGTGKTVVALHRAAYLLYTFRFPLEDQGVLVVGPNRVFLRYIERVLPSLGEAGVEQVVLADLVRGHNFGAKDSEAVSRIKGDLRMSQIIATAIKDRQRSLRKDVEIAFGAGYLRLTVNQSKVLVSEGRRRFRRHNAANHWVETEIIATMIASSRNPDADIETMRSALRDLPEFRAVINYIWPVLTPAELLHDLYSSKALLRLAAQKVCTTEEYESLHRQRAESLTEAKFSEADVAVLDEALSLLGPKPRRNGRINDADEVRTYGHIVIDEVQDLSPMQLRMISRRSLNGAMTIVGDIAQATSAHSPASWKEVLAHLPKKNPSRIIGLTVGYRIPRQIMELATRVLKAAAPLQTSPVSVREGDETPKIIATTVAALFSELIKDTQRMVDELSGGNVAIVCPDSMSETISAALDKAQIAHGHAGVSGIEAGLTVVPVSVVKGLELDGVIVVEPAKIVAAQMHGLRALYVALTRSTKQLSVLHSEPLPKEMI